MHLTLWAVNLGVFGSVDCQTWLRGGSIMLHMHWQWMAMSLDWITWQAPVKCLLVGLNMVSLQVVDSYTAIYTFKQGQQLFHGSALVNCALSCMSASHLFCCLQLAKYASAQCLRWFYGLWGCHCLLPTGCLWWWQVYNQFLSGLCNGNMEWCLYYVSTVCAHRCHTFMQFLY